MSKREKNYRNDLSAYWYTGPFFSSAMVIYPEGLAPDQPNEFAVQKAKHEINALNYPSFHPNSDYSRLINALSQVADKEEKKENEYINQLITHGQVTDDVARAMRNAQKNGDYSAAYTLLMHKNDDIKRLLEESKKPNFKIQKTNQFWETGFPAYFGQQIQLDMDNLTLTIPPDTSFDQLVENYIESVTNKAYSSMFDNIKNNFIEDLNKRYKSLKLSNGRNIIDISDSTKISNELKSSVYTKKGRLRKTTPKTPGKLSALLNNIANTCARNIAKGLSMEIYATTSLAEENFTTGHLRNSFFNALTNEYDTHQITNDVMGFTVYEGEVIYDTSSIKKDFENGLIEGTKDLRKRFMELAEEGKKVFEIDQNVKGYISRFDLKIKGNLSKSSGYTFKSQASFLAALNEKVPFTSFEKFMFLLNNTTEGAIAAGQEALIGKYIAMAVGFYLWDEMDNMISLETTFDTDNFSTLHVFNSGGAIVTASAIIRKGIENIKSELDKRIEEKVDSFATVNIKPPSAWTEYPAMRQARQSALAQTTSEQEWQSILEPSWYASRDYSLNAGRLEILIEQSKIERILSNISQYLELT